MAATVRPAKSLPVETVVRGRRHGVGYREGHFRHPQGDQQIARRYKGTPGLQVHINGQKVFAQGGWLQPDILFDMPAARIEAEVRYLAEANLNTVTFEDVPVPNEAFLEACDRYGLMYWCCFYGSYWIEPGRSYADGSGFVEPVRGRRHQALPQPPQPGAL